MFRSMGPSKDGGRNKVVFRGVTIFALLLGLASCQSQKKEGNASTGVSENRTWSQKMRLVSSQLEKIAPYIFSQKKFAQPENRSEFINDLTSFNESVASLSHHKMAEMPDSDPALKFVTLSLKEDVNRGLETYKSGNFEYSRATFRSALNNCFYCHTRTGHGPDFSAARFSHDLGEATLFDRVDFLVATRQFDRALEALEPRFASLESDVFSSFDREKALRKYLLISLRYKNDPGLARGAIGRYLDNKGGSEHFHWTADQWEKSLDLWQKDQRAGKKITLKSIERQMQMAAMKKEFLFDPVGDVEYIRASKELHELLKTEKSPRKRSRIYFLLGQCYDVLRDTGFWNLNEMYYEACVRAQPNTRQASHCYDNYERSVMIGYTGSAGTFVPNKIRQHLKRIREMSVVK